ncbi:O-succinylhomoserine sulfhydrylase [Candidatus Igneacidithiobacillus taiwanensis]|uniref:O-succinylhomoserine sulfhydrylase n=1 Tax=Candidatus Igneacidithiobacillus taiwanensis TaxID=1945924 RepID=UPI0028A09480|nr:O-succinylhomoserine sulfhydrylase [Candidatus Igneacidithiobacillus taiwanensis]MCE5359975.1 O-succinylhomoserine sulfhydrylase [Acidithiobacillus sp.]
MSEQEDWWQELHPETLAIRAGNHRTAEGEHSEPIFPTSSFVFDSAEEAADRFAGRAPGNIYARFTNPTTRIFEERLAALEGAEDCIATASGMAACLTACMGTLQAGDHIVASRSLFGTTVQLLQKILGRFAVETTFVSLTDAAAWEAAIRPNTRMLFLETPSNPMTEVGDLEFLATLAHAHNALLVVDNCFCTPVLQQPLRWGADLVLHANTKYIDGQGRTLGGAVCGSRALLEGPRNFLRTAGPSLSPFNAWVQLKGLETLALRMERHCANAAVLAQWLQQQEAVEAVYYPGLPEHPQANLVRKQQRLPGGILSFVLRGGQPAAWALVDQLRIFSRTANLGDAKSTVTHPASTTHSRVSAEERAAAGISDGLLRLSVGLEHVDDLRADLARALERLPR